MRKKRTYLLRQEERRKAVLKNGNSTEKDHFIIE